MTLIWTEATLEPKRKFRYLVTFTKLADFQFLAQTCDRPGMKIGQTEHKYFDKSFYHPGRISWDPNPLNIKVVDIQKFGSGNSTLDTNESLLQLFARAGVNGLINPDGSVVTVGKEAATSALGAVNIRVLNSSLNGQPFNGATLATSIGDTTTGVAEEWSLKNAWIESFKPDSLDYGAEDILTVTITVRYDWAEFKVHGESEPTNKFGPSGNQ